MDFFERCYAKETSIVARKIADEIILVPVRKNVGDLESIYTLNEVGAKIWELIDGKRKIKDIRDAILEEFDATEEQVNEDLREFIKKFEEIGGIKLIKKF
ncbi:MAG: PqqD family protein [Candidatus Schekmanbacteria bacterium]|nr:MAG: PqqD family protein [Candidatus Schekmanbacteria bacterium]